MSVDISVIVPIYYGEKYIDGMVRQIEEAAKRCEESKIELLLVNDAPDAPIDREVHSEIIDVYIHNTDHNRGIHGARVWGLSLAEGERILFLDQDDELSPDYFVSQLRIMEDADIVCCRGYEGQRAIYDMDRMFETSLHRESILKRPPMVSVGQALIKKSSIPELWKKNVITNNGSDDQFLWLSFLSEGKQFVGNNDYLFRHTKVGGNYSTDIEKLLLSDKEMIDILLEKGTFSDREKEILSCFPEESYKLRHNYQLKEQQILVLIDTMLCCDRRGYGVGEYLKRSGIKKIAIYGASILGKILYEIVKKYIRVEFFLDRNAEYMVSDTDISVYTIDDYPLNHSVDAVVITLMNGADKIEKLVKEKMNVETVVLQTVLEELDKKGFRNLIGWEE